VPSPPPILPLFIYSAIEEPWHIWVKKVYKFTRVYENVNRLLIHPQRKKILRKTNSFFDIYGKANTENINYTKTH
jgi:hypothetical protein